MSIQPKVPLILSIPAVFLLLILLCFTVAAQSQADSVNEVPLDPLLAVPLADYNQATLSVQELSSSIQVEQVFPNATATRTPTPINIGNFVWDDFDQDGRQDAGEPGMAGITVQLWNSTKTALLDSAVTNASGNYTVTAPIPGNYRVRVLLPNPAADLFSTKDQAAGDDQLDSDINPSGVNFGFTDIFNLASNVISTTIHDAGIIRYRTPTPTRTPTPINIGNFVWNDTDGDGYQTAGEVGLVGITVQLWNSSKTSLIASAITGSSGQYTVVAPVPGNYRVRVLAPVGASFTLKDQVSDTLDSDINASGSDTGFTDIISIASNVISITSIDAGLTNVPPTPTPTLTFTPSPTLTADVTASATPSVSSTYDTVAMYSKKLNLFSLVDTLQAIPAPENFELFASSSPEKGKFVMGDWDGDGQKTPGLFKGQSFWMTNQLGAGGAWAEVQIGDFGKIAVIAGRFDAAVVNDCIGVVQIENVSGHRFALHYTCELTMTNPPSGVLTQWIDIELNGIEDYQFIVGDWNGDGLDSIAVRRDKKITWGDTAPSQGAATFTGKQKFKTPNESYGAIVSGDWNGDGIDTFGIYSKGDGLFFYRNDLDKAKLTPSAQNLGLSIGKAFAASWRKTSSAASIDAPLPLPEVP